MQHILSPALAVALAVGAMSCAHDKGDPVAGLPGTMAVAIAVQGATRADDAPGEFESGSGLENTINLSNGYRILFFTAGDNTNGGGTYISTFSSQVNPGAIEADGSYYYDFIGALPSGLPTKFKLVVLANWSVYPSEGTVAQGELQLQKGKTTIKDVVTHASATFKHLTGGSDWLDDDNLIPFFGVREYDISAINPYAVADGKVKENAAIDLNKKEYALPLIRAMAKVEVINTNPTVKAFDAVAIDRVNDVGFCAPFSTDKSWNFTHEDYFHEYVWGTDFTRELHLVSGANDATPKGPLGFRNVSGKAKVETGEAAVEKWVAYVPEFRNVGVDDFCSILITVGDETKQVYFATNGSEQVNTDKKDVSGNAGTEGRYNIERNNIYRFTVTNKVPDPVIPPEPVFFDVDIVLDVQPFSEVKLDYDLGLIRDEQGDLMIMKDSQFWKELQAVFKEYSEFIPRTGNYINGKFVYGVWDENGEFTRDTSITDDMIANSFLGGNKDKPTDDTFENALKALPEVDYHPELNDYYAIVMAANGNLRESEIWVKDSDGCRVLSNFKTKIDNQATEGDQGCAARRVCDFSSGSPVTYFKDEEGFQRLQHNQDHSSVVLDHDKEMWFKTVKPGEHGNVFETEARYPVEDFTPYDQTTGAGGEFWYRISISQVPPSESESESESEPEVDIVFYKGSIKGEPTEEEIENNPNELTKTIRVKISDLSERDLEDLPKNPIDDLP